MNSEDVLTSLPSELLAQIFKHGTTSSSTLITYSAVSRHWRSTALTPDLWSSINVSFSCRNPAALIRVSLERSKSCLFDITLALPDPVHMPVVTSAMLLVVKHVHRLRRLAISATSFSSTPEEVFGLLQNAQRAPQLVALQLSFMDRNPHLIMGIPQGSLLMQAPMLSSLRLHGVTSPVPFVGLRSLDIQGLRTTYADFRDMVIASPLLTVLILPKLRLMFDLQSKALSPIDIPSLKTLALSFCKPHPSNELFTCHDLVSLLSVPNLEYLEIGGANVPDLAKSFQNNDFTKLRTLRLSNVSFSGRQFEVENCQFLRSLTAVEELELIHSHAEFLLPTAEKQKERLEVVGRRPRTRSINSRDIGGWSYFVGPVLASRKPPPEFESSSSTLIYPNLHFISLDTFIASETLWLYRIVLERPEIQLVKLSPMAQRHLKTSLGIMDGVLQTQPHLHLKKLGDPEIASVDVGKLLRERVAVQEIDNEGFISDVIFSPD
ncbi:hypothetical protein C8F04DRAFT_214481 [Mycena alexandri]|uniref:F-box domain-containing protein n=1 Tax=Mycena alexandri TaxID=1745969 RepID=A0AAD6TMJ4_9AGAR|nr:hypothetical protein C8F04DRAFT_214481 [Mycena alexandri]